jgi:hypothetical protein
MTSTRTLARALAALAFAAALPALAVVPPPGQPRDLGFAPGEAVVIWRRDAALVERDAQMLRLGAFESRRIARTEAQLVRFGRDADVRAMVARLKASGLVEIAEPNYIRRRLEECSAIVAPHTCPSDPDFNANFQFGLHDRTFDADMDLPEAWGVVSNANGIVLAIADDGFNLNHEDLTGDLQNGVTCQDTCTGSAAAQSNNEDHGSIVAGSAAGRSNNAKGIASPAYDANVLPIRLGLTAGGGFQSSWVANAIDYATTHNADLLNLSLGGPELSTAEFAAADSANAAGMLIVAAAGNDDMETDEAVASYPANFDLPNVIAVAASDNRDRIAGFSTWGPTRVDLAAPGAGIRSTWVGPSTSYTFASGTSFAAPYTAGVAALVGQRLIDLGYTTFDYRELKALLLAGADHASDQGDLELRGRVAAGRVNAAKSVAKAAQLVAGTLGGVLVVDSVVVDDPPGLSAGNDDDDLPDAGETVDLIVTLSNAWQAAGTVAATLSSTDAGVTVVDGNDTSTAIGAFGLGSVAFRVTLGGTTNRQALFRLDLTPTTGAIQTRFFYFEFSPPLRNGALLTQTTGRNEWDEFHAWNVNVPAGATNVVFETDTASGRDIDLLARRGQKPEYQITIGVDPDTLDRLFHAGQESSNPAIVSGEADGRELIGDPSKPATDIGGTESGSWNLVVVNFAQQMIDYTIRASWDAAGAGTIRFNAETATVNEAAGTVTLTVVRSGGVGAVSANYASAGGTAESGTDFTAVGGTLNWAAGDTAAKTITVPIANDGIAESAEAFTVALSSPAGGADLGRYQTFTVTIAGSTAPPPPPPPPPPSGGGGGGGGATDALLLLALGALAAARRRRPTA